jgi:hypothetical protein
MLKVIPYNQLRTGDLIHATSYSFIATAIRIREVGIKRAFSKSIATHTGIVLTLENGEMVAIAEMKSNGLKVNSFSDYLKKGPLDPGIISISRHPKLDDPLLLEKYRSELTRLWKEGKKYDLEGCLKWAFPFLKEKNKDFYCSELAEYLALFCGFSYFRNNPGPNDNVMPFTLQNSPFMTRIC